MVRRIAKSATVLVVLAFGIFTIPSADFLEALTSANLASLIGGGTLIEGDKTFSNFDYTPISLADPVGGLTLLGAADITVTAATGPGGLITLSVPLGMSVLLPSGESGFTAGLVSFSFDVSVDGTDVITGVSIAATGAQSGPLADAGASANLTGGGFIEVPVDGSVDTAALPGLQTLGVAANASVVAEVGGESASVDEVVFTFEQTTPSAPVPEPGSLTLILGGAAMLLARGLPRRRS
jgi:hypothetical protein